MVNEIPNFKIGMDLTEVEQYVQNSNLDKKTKQSVFDFINEDRKLGDGKITHRGELQMILNLITGNKDMPEEVPLVKGSKVEKHDWGKSVHNLIYRNDSGKYVTERSEISDDGSHLTYTHYNGDPKSDLDREDVVDTFRDDDGDGTMDYRRTQFTMTRYGQHYGIASYTDDDLDGAYDRRVLVIKGQPVGKYEKDENGEWKKVDDFGL